MTEGAPRGVTRGYVGGLIVASAIVATALVVVGWGLLSLVLSRPPVAHPDVPLWVAPLVVILALAALAWGLWRQALGLLLRGRRAPAWGIVVSLAGGAYLIWCLAGMLAGMGLSDTWTSPFAALLAAIWALVPLLFWGVLARRVYTDRPVPKWPWEREEEGE